MASTSSSSSSSSRVMGNSGDDNYNKPKPVIVRVKRKADQSPLHALWLEINERPLKRPLLDFQNLSLSTSSDFKTTKLLVQHVETVNTSQDALLFLNSFVQPQPTSDNKASTKQRSHSLQKDKKHDQLLSKARKEQEDLAKSARFEQIWKRRRGNKEALHDEALDQVCRVYDVVRVDEEEASGTGKQQEQEEITAEDQEILSKFLPLLRECTPSAAQEIESDFCSHALRRDSADEYVYDLYAVEENIDETEAPYPFPLVHVDDDDNFYDGPDDSEYETDDSNAENHPLNDYPEEESTDDEEKESESSGIESDEEKSESESDTCANSDNSETLDGTEDVLYEDEMDENFNDDSDQVYDNDGSGGEDWRWGYR